MYKSLFHKGTVLVAMLLAFAVSAAAQVQVRGTVTSASTSEPVIGAGVMVTGTTIGVITDINGEYSITVPDGSSTLLFSCLGYSDATVEIAGRSVLNVQLEDASDWLEETVVIGYGVQKKKLTTGANLQVKGEDLSKRNTVSALQALQGQTPGMQITSESGQPGSSMKVRIRGIGTVGSSSPLYIVDGVPGDISKVNPTDIESIDVLKDAASAAIYGAQAANGVVLVTTKSGKKGSAQVYYDGYYGVQNVYRVPEMLDAEQYKVIMNEQNLNSGAGPIDWDSYTSGANTNWVSQMFRKNAPTQNHTVGVSGGSDTSVYSLSFNYSDQQGIVGDADHSRAQSYKFRINTEHHLFGNLLTVGEHATYVKTTSAGVGDSGYYNNALRPAIQNSPLLPVYGNNYYGWGDSNGLWADQSIDTDAYNASNGSNPYASMMLGKSSTVSNNLNGDVYVELQPVEKLKIRSTFGLNYWESMYHSIGYTSHWCATDSAPQTPTAESDFYASVGQSGSAGYSISWINTASYDFTLGDDHNLSAMIGSEWDRSSGSWLSASSKISVDQYKDFEHAYLSNGISNTEYWSLSGAPNDEDKTLSFFTRLGYNYKEKYMVNATFRADGSSMFAKGHRWGFFPSVSAGWVVTEEDFLKGNDVLDFFKLRGSWGQVGNKNITAYAYSASISTSDHSYNFGSSLGASAEQSGALQSRLANEDIKWETSEQLDFGFDSRFFDGRLSANFDWYLKTTKDWLVEAPVVATAGADAPYVNGGDVSNSGVELAINWNESIGRDFHYTIGVNGAYNKNVVGNIANADGIIHGGTGELFDNSKEFYRAENGHAIGYWYGFQTAGIFQNQQEIDDWIAHGNGVFQSSVQPGDVKFVDQNGDGVIDDNDKVDLGHGTPDFSYGFNIALDWKGFDFQVTAYGAAGNKIVQSYRNWSNQYPNYTTAVLQRWTGEGTSNRIPRVTNANVNYAEFSDLFLQDGDYLRISNITLGYDFANIIKASWLDKARLYVSVQNAFTFTKYDGFDPELGYGTDTNNWCAGVDIGNYPHARTFLVGVNLAFGSRK